VIDYRAASWVAWMPLGARRFLVSLARLLPRSFGTIPAMQPFARFSLGKPGNRLQVAIYFSLDLMIPSGEMRL